jgi:uncharacterized membrane protein
MSRHALLAKAITYRLLGSGFGFVCAWVLSGDWKVGVGVFGLDALGKVVLYYIFERVWERVSVQNNVPDSI